MMESERSGYISNEAMKKVIESVGKHKGVWGAVLCDTDGLPLQSSLPSDDTEKVAAHVGSLMGKVKSITKEIAKESARSVRLELEKGEVF